MPGYSKTTWTDFVTVANAANLNHIETGIYNADPGFYSARLYGAVGDGVTDDRAAIQAALDAARTAGGGTVYLEALTYLLGGVTANGEIATLKAALQIGDRCNLVGMGAGRTRLKLGGGWVKNPLMQGFTPTREFWVSTTGNNGNTGTKNSPFLTIAFAVQQCTVAGGGYMIHVAPGVYNEATIDTYAGATANGANGNPNVIISDVPWGAQINSTASGATGRAAYLKLGWWIVGFEITGGSLAQSGAVMLDGSYTAAIGNWIHDFSRSIGAAQGGSGINVTSTAYTGVGIIIAFNYLNKVGPTGSSQGHGIYANGNGTIVASNLVTNCDGAGIEAFHTPSNLVIVNNTIHACDAGALGGGITIGSGDAGWTVSGCLVANNIITNDAAWGILEFVSGGATMGANTYTNNCEFNNTSGAFHAIGANTNANAVTSDPLYINAQTDGSGDFRLRSTSPCIDAGSDASMPAGYGAMDILGYTRPQGTHRDIGAYEYNAWAAPSAFVISNYNPSTGNKDITIANLTVDGGAAAATGEAGGIELVKVQRPRVDRVTVKNCLGGFDQGVNDPPGVQLDYCSDGDLSSVMVTSDDGGPPGSGVVLRYCFNINARGVITEGLTYGNGISIDSSTHVRLSSAGIGGCGGKGLVLRNVTDVTLEDCDLGMDAPAVAVAGYTASQHVGNTGHGLYAINSSFKAYNSRALRNGGSGFWIDGQGTVDLVAVEARSNTADGLTVGGAVGGGSIRANGIRLKSNTGYGAQILTAALAQLTRLQDYVIASNTAAQLRILSTNYATSGNIAAPSVPASTTALTNPYPFDCVVFVTGGTMTLCSLDGSGVGIATSPIYLRVRAGGTITFTYTVAPSWSWFLEN